MDPNPERISIAAIHYNLNRRDFDDIVRWNLVKECEETVPKLKDIRLQHSGAYFHRGLPTLPARQTNYHRRIALFNILGVVVWALILANQPTMVGYLLFGCCLFGAATSCYNWGKSE